MGMYNTFAPNKARETAGVPVNFQDQFIVGVRRAGISNAAFVKHGERFGRANKALIDNGLLSTPAAVAAFADLYANTVVSYWFTRDDENGTHNDFAEPVGADYKGPRFREGIELPSGDVVPYTPEHGKAAFLALSDIVLETCRETASSAHVFLKNAGDAVAKN